MKKMSLAQTSVQAKHYNSIKNFLFFAHVILMACLLLFFVVVGFSAFLRAYLRMGVINVVVLNALYFLIFYGVMMIFFFPLEWYEGFKLEHQFGVSRENFLHWCKDYCTKNVLTFIMLLFLVELFYVLIGRFEHTWWICAAVVWLGVSVVLTKVFPLVILPLFLKSHPLPEGPLKVRLRNVAKQFEFNITDIFVLELSVKTSKANAMVTGLGRTKKIYLSDTLLTDFTEQEIAAAAAHELTHNKHGDLYKHLFVSFAVSIFSFYFCNLFLERGVFYFGYNAKDDIASLPLLMLLITLAGIIVLPLQNGFSRKLERDADRGALQATNNAHAFITMITKLGEKNLSEFSPNKALELFLYDHPSIHKRIAAAETFIVSQV